VCAASSAVVVRKSPYTFPTWHILTFPAPPPPAVEAFFQKFVQIYESHGGVVAAHPQHGKKPWLGPGNLADGGEMVQKVWNQTGNR
jgi:hypothetical protein